MPEIAPINDQIADFLESVDNAASTKLLYRRTISYFYLWMVRNNRVIHEPKMREIINYRDYLRSIGLSPATIDNYLAALRTFFKWLVYHGYSKESPITGILKKEQSKRPVYVKQCLTIDQVRELINSTGDKSIIELRNKAVIQLMVFTGLRCIEVSRLRYGGFTPISGKYFLQVWRKGQRSDCEAVFIPASVAGSINRYLRERKDELNKDTPLFINHGPRNGSGRIQSLYISRIIKEHLRKIGLDDRKYSAHSLRHTAASLAQLAGAELYEIQYMLGHQNASQTERYLRSLGRLIGNEGAAVKKIEEYFKSIKKKKKSTQKTIQLP